ncbi:hypothetical protein [Peribacillus butanolivorans]
MQCVVDKINNWIIKVPNAFSGMSELEVSQRPMPDKWSKKEILGHLCDSAINNLEKLSKFNMKNNHLPLPHIIKISGWIYRIIKIYQLKK